MINKTSTPMNKLKDNFSNFNNYIELLSIPFVEKNHMEYTQYKNFKYTHSNIEKEVEADFSRVYFIGEYTELAFHFFFLSEDKQNMLENQYLEVSLKEDDVLFNSSLYTIHNARELIKNINKKLKLNDDLDKAFLLDLIKETVFTQQEKQDELFADFEDVFDYETAELQSHFFAENEYIDNLKENLSKSINTLKHYSENMDEAKRIKELETEIKKLKTTFRSNIENKAKELKIEEEKELLKKAEVKKDKLFQKIKCLGRKINEMHKLSILKIDNIINKKLYS